MWGGGWQRSPPFSLRFRFPLNPRGRTGRGRFAVDRHGGECGSRRPFGFRRRLLGANGGWLCGVAILRRCGAAGRRAGEVAPRSSCRGRGCCRTRRWTAPRHARHVVLPGTARYSRMADRWSGRGVPAPSCRLCECCYRHRWTAFRHARHVVLPGTARYSRMAERWSGRGVPAPSCRMCGCCYRHRWAAFRQGPRAIMPGTVRRCRAAERQRRARIGCAGHIGVVIRAPGLLPDKNGGQLRLG